MFTNKVKTLQSKSVGEKNTDKYGSPFGTDSYMNSLKTGYMWGALCSGKDNMLLSEGVQGASGKYDKGGIIVIPTDANAIQPDIHKMADWIKQTLATLRNSAPSADATSNSGEKDEWSGWSIGHYFDGKYNAKNGKLYDNNALSVEIIGGDTDMMIRIAEDLCRDFKQECVLLKDYSSHQILLIDPQRK